MRHESLARTTAASVWLLTACQLEALVDEFHMTEPPLQTTHLGDTTTTTDGSSTSSGTDGSSTSSGTAGSTSTAGASHGDESTNTPATEAQTTTPDSTGAPVSCGDGIVDGDDECDDGNDDDLDACDNTCAAAWTLFVTAEAMYTGNVNGLVGADTRCRQQAAIGDLPRSDHYVALLSDSTTDAAERLHNARGWYRLVNGLPVAHGWDALMTGPLENPVNVTQMSQTANVTVWTGTLPGGIAVPGAEHCMDWKDDVFDSKGHWGWSAELDAAWLHWPQPDTNPTLCDFSAQALYCVEQP